MKTKILYFITVLITGTTLLLSCSKDNGDGDENGKFTATAIATIGGITSSKASYNDTGESSTITASWENGDVIYAFETEKDSVKVCKFTTTETGATANFKSADAKTPSTSTSWKALYGGAAKIGKDSFTCGYDGQDGTLANLKNYDYMIAEGNGTSPTFGFRERSLSSFIRLKLPEGIKTIEFNTAGEWTIKKSETTAPKPTTERVSTITLANTSNAGSIVYIAVPGIEYSTTGLIFTIFNSDKSKSQGCVISLNANAKEGCITTVDMSGLTLMDRPTTYIDLGNSSKWAPFNVGAKPNPTTPEEAYGNYYGFGEIEPSYKQGSSTELYYDWNTYMCKKDECGTSKDPIREGLYTVTIEISGSRFDVARVKWGKGWRMPTYDRLSKLLKGTWSDSTPYGATTVAGDIITGSNGNTLVLPAAGIYAERLFHVGKVVEIWSSSLSEYEEDSAANFYRSVYFDDMSGDLRATGATVRAIAE